MGKASDGKVPSEAQVINGKGLFVTPGLIDTHSILASTLRHMSEQPQTATRWPDDTICFSEHAFGLKSGLRTAVMGGTTTILVLPGSGNVIGGRAVVLQLDPRRETRAMRFHQAPFGLKMACGENPKRVYGSKGRQPMSRMGSISILRRKFIKAQAYRHAQRVHAHERAEWLKKYEKAKNESGDDKKLGKEPFGPARDVGLETLADVLDGKIKVHIHCYRADEMLQMIVCRRNLVSKLSATTQRVLTKLQMFSQKKTSRRCGPIGGGSS